LSMCWTSWNCPRFWRFGAILVSGCRTTMRSFQNLGRPLLDPSVMAPPKPATSKKSLMAAGTKSGTGCED
jgi:hypothetical protein